MDASDAELLRRWREDDQAAARELFSRHFKSLYRFFATKSGGGVEDLVQETLLACVRGRDRLHDDGSFKAYMFTVARRVLQKHYAQRERRADVDLALASVVDLSPGPVTPEEGLRLPPPDATESVDEHRVRGLLMQRMFGDAPHRIGRFTIVEQVGRGAMGTVHAAYDPELDRRVALKVLRASEHDHAWLAAEARAMAKLSHPNVAPVYEVGVHEGRVFIAMEFVRGRTLRAWAQDGRPWREVVAVYRQAGAGLAAAHEAGIIHRDFKPDNALLGDDGRVRVVDFGLARAAELVSTPSPTDSGSTPTVPGTSVVGTPAYMAPEQARGEAVDARADQFSFCVALYEALFGARPFEGTTRLDLLAAIERGQISAPPGDGRVPPWVRAVLLHRARARGRGRSPARARGRPHGRGRLSHRQAPGREGERRRGRRPRRRASVGRRRVMVRASFLSPFVTDPVLGRSAGRICHG
jgi:RNA polymerase sigma factor (sigma-70 family)